MLRTILFLFIISPILFLPADIYSQTDKSRSIGDILIDDAVIYGTDVFDFFTAPAHFTWKEVFYTAAIAGGTALLITADEGIKEKVGRNTTATLNKDFWDIPTSYGIITYANIFSFGTYAAGLIAEEDDIRITGRMLIESLTISGISVMGIRYIAGRLRPYYNKGPWEFYGFESSNEIQSFPSGHTTVAFALSTVLAERIDNIYGRIFFYGLASLTAFARVYNNQHWFSDVVTGALLGLGSGFFVVYKEKERNSHETNSSFNLYPSFNGINLVLEL